MTAIEPLARTEFIFFDPGQIIPSAHKEAGLSDLGAGVQMT
jgi:hypothetical protein